MYSSLHDYESYTKKKTFSIPRQTSGEPITAKQDGLSLHHLPIYSLELMWQLAIFGKVHLPRSTFHQTPHSSTYKFATTILLLLLLAYHLTPPRLPKQRERVSVEKRSNTAMVAAEVPESIEQKEKSKKQSSSSCK